MAYVGLGQTVGSTIEQCVEQGLAQIPPYMRKGARPVIEATCREQLAEQLLTAVEAAPPPPDPGTYPTEGPTSSTSPVQPGTPPAGGTYTSGPSGPLVQAMVCPPACPEGWQPYPTLQPPPPAPTEVVVTGPAAPAEAGIGALFGGGTLLPIIAGVAVLGALLLATRS